MQKATHCLKWGLQTKLRGRSGPQTGWFLVLGKLEHPRIHHCCRRPRASREEPRVALTGSCRSRCVGICFPAISRCYSQTPMWLTSRGHKTLARIVSSEPPPPSSFFFLDHGDHKAIYGRWYKKHATFNPSTYVLRTIALPDSTEGLKKKTLFINTPYKTRDEEKRQYGEDYGFMMRCAALFCSLCSDDIQRDRSS